MKTHAELLEDVEDFLTQTEEARILSERDRDYKDNKQWTAEETAKIESRGQAAITVNRIKPKVEGLKGLLIQRKTDPKAFPRTQKHEKTAEVITDGLRYIADNNDFDKKKLAVAENIFVEGYGAIVTTAIEKGNDIEIVNTVVPWDRYYYDVHSRELDFSDKRWDGIVIWMDIEEAKESFNITQEDIDAILEQDGDETFDDRPRWVDRIEKRIRVCWHFYIQDKVWHMCYFTASRFLVKPIPSPLLDEYGEPCNPIEAQAANIDRDNNRFGEVRYWIDLQDEINHRRSKYLFMLSQRQTMSRKGAILDVPSLKRELAKSDGHVEYQGEKGDFDILPTGDMAEAQFTLYQDGKSELDAVGFNAQLSGERQGDLSGTAITNLQQAATNELASLYAGLTDLERRVYRQNWMRMKQFWTEEKWLRVTDDSTKLRWVGLNQKITLKQQLEEIIEDESLYPEQRLKAQADLKQMLQVKHPALNELVEVRNEVGELDVDIMIETSYDSVNVQREQFELLSNIAQTRPDVPFTEVLKLSELRGKDKIIKSIEASSQAQQERQKQIEELESRIRAIEAAEIESKTILNQAKSETERGKAHKAHTEAELTELQANLIVDNPPKDTGVVI